MATRSSTSSGIVGARNGSRFFIVPSGAGEIIDHSVGSDGRFRRPAMAQRFRFRRSGTGWTAGAPEMMAPTRSVASDSAVRSRWLYLAVVSGLLWPNRLPININDDPLEASSEAYECRKS